MTSTLSPVLTTMPPGRVLCPYFTDKANNSIESDLTANKLTASLCVHLLTVPSLEFKSRKAGLHVPLWPGVAQRDTR